MTDSAPEKFAFERRRLDGTRAAASHIAKRIRDEIQESGV